jgi:hypothetical protein
VFDRKAVVKIADVFMFFFGMTQIFAQGRSLKCGRFVYRTDDPKVVVIKDIECPNQIAEPSPWPIIKAIAATPNDWALKSALYQPLIQFQRIVIPLKRVRDKATFANLKV